MHCAYIYDQVSHRETNRQGRNFWETYWPEICDRLGLTAFPLSSEALSDPAALADIAILMVGKVSPDLIDPEVQKTLQNWVEGGGLLIGSATENLDELFGITFNGTLPQPADDFTPAASLRFWDHRLTEGLHWPLKPDQGPVVFSGVRLIQTTHAESLADLITGGGHSASAGVTIRKVGKGWAFYFPFELPKTCWVVQQGRPVTGDRDGDGYLRVGDAIVLPGPWDVPSTDLLLWLLRNLVACCPCPLLAPFPPLEGQIPDALFFWGGDDEAATDGLQVFASDWMRSQDLPYHINAMPVDGRFGLTPEEARHIEANGHEISLHYNYINDHTHPYAFTREDVLAQMKAFIATFGKRPVCTVNHWCCWTGWSEPARWMLQAGGQGDNSRLHWGSPPINPVNRYGFAFGTSFPFHIYEDAAHGNQRLDFVIQPITAYEVGYEGENTDFETLHRVIDLTVRYHLTTNMFYHPVYITHYPACRKAIEEFRRYLMERNIFAIHQGNDAFCLWWKARGLSSLSGWQPSGDVIACEADVRYDGGAIIQIPLGERSLQEVLCDGQPVIWKLREEFGNRWVWVVVPSGKHRVVVQG